MIMMILKPQHKNSNDHNDGYNIFVQCYCFRTSWFIQVVFAPPHPHPPPSPPKKMLKTRKHFEVL